MSNCHTNYGATVAERISQAVKLLSIENSPSTRPKVTISVGCQCPQLIRSTISLWTGRVDVQLYRAKAGGRNCVFLDKQQEIYVSAKEKNFCSNIWPWVNPLD
ncbi:MAG: diguanylate cyclase [Candidatus Saccharibacteria bacterium]|nr:diguanylate cyclase [Rhodoferax sp.]